MIEQKQKQKPLFVLGVKAEARDVSGMARQSVSSRDNTTILFSVSLVKGYRKKISLILLFDDFGTCLLEIFASSESQLHLISY